MSKKASSEGCVDTVYSNEKMMILLIAISQ